jgi:hypothetical protein
MKRTLITIFFFTFAWGLAAQSARDIVNKCIAALGGREAIEKRQTFKAEGSLMIKYGAMALKGKLKMINDREKTWMQSNLKFGDREFLVIRAYDGKAAWQEMMGNVTDSPTLNNKHDAEHTILLLIDGKSTFKRGKSTEIEGRKTVGIEVTNHDKTTTFFIDTETYLPREILFKDQYFGESKQKEILEKRIRLMDYKKQQGILFPMKTVFYQKGKRGVELQYNRVQFIAEVDKSIFKRPDKKKDFSYSEEIMH